VNRVLGTHLENSFRVANSSKSITQRVALGYVSITPSVFGELQGVIGRYCEGDAPDYILITRSVQTGPTQE